MTVDIAELRKLLEKATPGPWWAVGPAGHEPGSIIASPGSVVVADYSRTANGPLIVAAVNALPALLDRIEAQDHRLALLERVNGIQHNALYRIAAPGSDGKDWVRMTTIAATALRAALAATKGEPQ